MGWATRRRALLYKVNSSESSDRRRTRLGSAGGRTVTLGPAGKTYFLAEHGSEAMKCCVEILGQVISMAAENSWSWPAVSQQLVEFADQASAFAKGARSVTCRGYGLRGGRTSETKNRYMIKHFVRLLLLASPSSGYCRYSSGWCEASDSSGIGELLYERVAEWTPDEREHCKQFDSRRCDEIERLFGVHPLLLSAWSCLLKQVSPDGRQMILDAGDKDIITVLDNDEALQANLLEANQFRIGPRALAAALQKMQEA